MRLFTLGWLLILVAGVSPFRLHAQTESKYSEGCSFLKLGNGLNFVAMPIPQVGNTELTFYIQTGSLFENDSLSGIANIMQNIIADKIANNLRSNKNVISFQNTAFSASTTSEQSLFRFVIQTQNLGPVLTLVKDSLFNPKIYQSELAKVKNSVLQEIEDAKHDKKKVFGDKMIKSLYREDHQKLEILGDPKDFRNIDKDAVIAFFEKYYVPNNTLATITGNVNVEVAQQQFTANLSQVIRSDFDPKTVTRIVGIKPLAYTSQFIVEDTTRIPEFQICWQFPGTANNKASSYSAYLVNAMLNDPNNFIQVKAGKMGCKKFQVQYDANNYSGVLRITLQATGQNLMPVYQFVMKELGRLDKTLLNQTMINAGKLQFKREFLNLRKTKEFPAQIVKHWAYNDDSYFPELNDSVFAVSEKQLHNFVVENMNQSPHVSGLRISSGDRKSLNIDSSFTDLDESVAKYVFKYRPNVTTLEGEDNSIMLHNLLQWLTINNDITVQVNGYSDEHEYNRATDDDSVLEFIDSIPSFKTANLDFKKSGYLRPEMMRALKIAKYLYENGISAERIFGTSMPFKSSNKKEEMSNLKCTLTLNKYRKSPSLLEYHYGKKE